MSIDSPNLEDYRTRELALVCGDDWQGLYMDGYLIREGHSAGTGDLFDELFDVERIESDYDWLMERGALPERLSEVVRA